MTQYYIKQNNNIVLWMNDKQNLLNSLIAYPQLKGLPILETSENEIIVDNVIISKEEAQINALNAAKENKKEQATQGAYNFLSSGDAVYEIEEGKSIEATDGNIGKLAAYALGFITGTFKPDDTIEWTTKEDVRINLTQEQLSQVLQGLGIIQANVWNVQFPNYITQIEEAQSVEEVNAIEINYTSEVPVTHDPEENKETNDEEESEDKE